MPTGRPIGYERLTYEDLKEPHLIEPPEGTFRVYLHSETGYIRYLHGLDADKKLTPTNGFPLLPDYPDEFDCELDRLWVIAGMQDSALSIYYYKST